MNWLKKKKEEAQIQDAEIKLVSLNKKSTKQEKPPIQQPQPQKDQELEQNLSEIAQRYGGVFNIEPSEKDLLFAIFTEQKRTNDLLAEIIQKTE